jgi:hypothetical protein
MRDISRDMLSQSLQLCMECYQFTHCLPFVTGGGGWQVHIVIIVLTMVPFETPSQIYRVQATRFTNAISGFEPGPQDHHLTGLVKSDYDVEIFLGHAILAFVIDLSLAYTFHCILSFQVS